MLFFVFLVVLLAICQGRLGRKDSAPRVQILTPPPNGHHRQHIVDHKDVIVNYRELFTKCSQCIDAFADMNPNTNMTHNDLFGEMLWYFWAGENHLETVARMQCLKFGISI